MLSSYPIRQLALLSIALCLFIIACDGDDEDDFSLVGTETSAEELAGDWNATQGFFSRATSGPVVETDVVADGGSITLSIQSNGRFTLTIAPLGEVPEVTTGRIAFDEELLVVFFDDDPDEFEFFVISHNEPNLSISGGNGSVEFDFDGDGVDEPADVGFVFVRI